MKENTSVFINTHNPIKNFRNSRFNIIPAKWRILANAQGKLLNDRKLQVLWTLLRLANYSNSDAIEIDYTFLNYQCGFNCSQDLMRRYLKDIASSEIIQYEVKRSHSSYKKQLRIKMRFEKMNSVLECDFKGRFTQPICPVNRQGYNIEENSINNKDISDIDTTITARNVIESVSKESEFYTNSVKEELPSMKLIDCHPLSDEMVIKLNTDANRTFGSEFVNKLLLKLHTRLESRNANYTFPNRNSVLSYMLKSLKAEKALDDGIAIRERYLTSIENSRFTDNITRLKQRIIGKTSPEEGYGLLTKNSYFENPNDVSVVSHQPLNIKESEIIKAAVADVYGQHMAVKFKQKLQKSSESSPLSFSEEDTSFSGLIRTKLRKIYPGVYGWWIDNLDFEKREERMVIKYTSYSTKFYVQYHVGHETVIKNVITDLSKEAYRDKPPIMGVSWEPMR